MKRWEQPEIYVLGVESTKGGNKPPPPDPGSDANLPSGFETKKYGPGDDKFINDQAEEDSNKWGYYFYSS
jgi:hypothetical protein